MIKRIAAHAKKTYAELALLSVEVIAVSIWFFVSFFVFIFVAQRIFLKHKEAFDHRVFDFLTTYVSGANTAVMQFFTFLGTAQFIIPANLVLFVYFGFIKKHRWYSIKIPVIAVTSFLLMESLKQLFNRPRPLVPLLHSALGLSFPSGHAFTSVTFYGLLCYIIWERMKNPYLKWTLIAALIILIHLIGFSRIYLRVHYASDVLAGFCLGFIWLMISLVVLRRIERYTHKTIAPVVEGVKSS